MGITAIQPSLPAPSTLQPPPLEVLEEYKEIRYNAIRTSDRRQRTNDLFVGINVLFVTGLGLLLISARLNSWEAIIEAGVISVAVLPINLAWYRVLKLYRAVLTIHYACLEDVERRYRFVENLSLRLAGHPSTTDLELRLAVYFLAFYPLMTIVVGLLTYVGTKHLEALFALI